jgi:hypothetical protein
MVRKTIRVHRRESAFVYAILESLEGMASFSTLPHAPNQDHRDLALSIPAEFLADVDTVLDGMRKKMPVVEVSNPC